MKNPDLNELKDKLSFAKRLPKLIGKAMLLLVAAMLLLSATYTVSEQENAVVMTFGKVTSTKTAGLHLKLPFVQSVRKVNMTTMGTTLGYTEDTNENPGDESLMITSDFNIVSVDLYVEYRVTNPERYCFSATEPELVLRNAILSSARDIISGNNVDSILTDGKAEIQAAIRELTNEVLDRYDIGITVTDIIIQDAEPPTEEVKIAFKNVEDAKQQKDTLLNEAKQYENEKIPAARAQADKVIKAAEAEKTARINEATGQVARFNEMYSEYANNSEITRTRMFYEAIEEIYPDLKIIIDSGGSGTLKFLNLDAEEGGE